MTELFTRRLHLPKFRHKMAKTKKFPQVRYTETLCTLNNTSRWIRYSQEKIKNEYKDSLREYIIPEPETMYDELTVHYRLIRHNKTRLDKDNVVWAIKWLTDLLETLGYIKDDRVVNFKTFDTIIDEELPETMFEIRVLSGSEKW